MHIYQTQNFTKPKLSGKLETLLDNFRVVLSFVMRHPDELPYILKFHPHDPQYFNIYSLNVFESIADITVSFTEAMKRVNFSFVSSFNWMDYSIMISLLTHMIQSNSDLDLLLQADDSSLIQYLVDGLNGTITDVESSHQMQTYTFYFPLKIEFDTTKLRHQFLKTTFTLLSHDVRIMSVLDSPFNKLSGPIFDYYYADKFKSLPRKEFDKYHRDLSKELLGSSKVIVQFETEGRNLQYAVDVANEILVYVLGIFNYAMRHDTYESTIFTDGQTRPLTLLNVFDGYYHESPYTRGEISTLIGDHKVFDKLEKITEDHAKDIKMTMDILSRITKDRKMHEFCTVIFENFEEAMTSLKVTTSYHHFWVVVESLLRRDYQESYEILLRRFKKLYDLKNNNPYLIGLKFLVKHRHNYAHQGKAIEDIELRKQLRVIVNFMMKDFVDLLAVVHDVTEIQYYYKQYSRNSQSRIAKLKNLSDEISLLYKLQDKMT